MQLGSGPLGEGGGRLAASIAGRVKKESPNTQQGLAGAESILLVFDSSHSAKERVLNLCSDQ